MKAKAFDTKIVERKILLLMLRFQTVAHIPDSFNQMSIGTQHLTQCTDMHIHCTGFQ